MKNPNKHFFNENFSTSKTAVGYLLSFLLLLSCYILATPVLAWTTVNGVAISTAGNDQTTPAIVSDGAGGAIITWADDRYAVGSDIFAQRVDSTGSTLWTLDGVVICTAINNQSSPAIVSDGSGGAIITWEDHRSPDYGIYAQRVDSTGSTLWILNGVAICTEGSGQYFPAIASDESGGAVITWQDSRNGNADVYVQRVGSTGSPLWTINGVALCTASLYQQTPKIASNGSGGAIVTWTDLRSDLYAQGVDSSGSIVGTLDGIPICTAGANQRNPDIVSDGTGGAIITWEDYRSGLSSDIYAQRVDSTMSTLWTSNGINICTAGNNQISPAISSDGSNGAIMTWQDYRSTTGNLAQGADIYSQRVDSTGSTSWTLNGITICTAVGDQITPAIIGDGSGGALISWTDSRNGNKDIYVLQIDSTGNTDFVNWTPNGTPICTVSNDQQYPSIASDGSGGAIMTWQDGRSGTSNDIYAQSILSNGNLPVELSDFQAIAGTKE